MNLTLGATHAFTVACDGPFETSEIGAEWRYIEEAHGVQAMNRSSVDPDRAATWNLTFDVEGHHRVEARCLTFQGNATEHVGWDVQVYG